MELIVEASVTGGLGVYLSLLVVAVQSERSM